MSQRLSRKEIKRDEFMETLTGAFDYVRGHSHGLLIAAAFVVALAVVAALFLNYRDRRERLADEALAQAMRVQQAPIDAAAAQPDDPLSPSFADVDSRTQKARELFEGVREKFRSSDAADIASVYLGQIAAAEGDLSGARAHWDDFLSGQLDHLLAAEVRLNLMSLDRAEGRGEELVTRLRAMVSGDTVDLPRDLLLHELALTLDGLGRQAEADEAYRRILEEYPQSVFAPDARARVGGPEAQLLGP